MTLRLFISSFLSNIVNILVNLYPTLIAFFRKTSAIAVATLQVTANFRYHFLQTDNSTLYSKYSRSFSINVKKAPQYNLDDWLNPSSHNFISTVHDTIFHYHARAEKNERVEVCISTKAMEDTTWKYGHHNQIILDGTFGICS